jgi:hypothetical protein
MTGVVTTLKFCDGYIMVLRLLFLLPNLVLEEGLGKRDDLILEFHGMLCWLLNILISLFLDIVQAFNFQSGDGHGRAP